MSSARSLDHPLTMFRRRTGLRGHMMKIEAERRVPSNGSLRMQPVYYVVANEAIAGAGFEPATFGL
jgi:hypothetical protein